jgi:hypothetical protein
VTLVGSTLVMFGGEDSKRHLMDDLHILDLESLTWEAMKQGTLPQLLHHDHVVTLMFKDNRMIYMVCLLPKQLQHILKFTLVWPFFSKHLCSVPPYLL